jgi:hypothetical protein
LSALPITIISCSTDFKANFIVARWPKWKGWNLPINRPLRNSNERLIQ